MRAARYPGCREVKDRSRRERDKRRSWSRRRRSRTRSDGSISATKPVKFRSWRPGSGRAVKPRRDRKFPKAGATSAEAAAQKSGEPGTPSKAPEARPQDPPGRGASAPESREASGAGVTSDRGTRLAGQRTAVAAGRMRGEDSCRRPTEPAPCGGARRGGALKKRGGGPPALAAGATTKVSTRVNSE